MKRILLQSVWLALCLAVSVVTALAQAATAGQKTPDQATSDLPRAISERGWSLPPPVKGKTDNEQKPSQTLRIETDVVTFDVVATDRNGNYIRDLRAEDFELVEDGRTRAIELFNMTNESTLSRPLAVVFALDLSGSLKPEEASTLRDASLRFTELMKGESVFAAIAFNYDVKVLQGFTDDPRKIERAFGKLERFEGSTRIYDALDRSITLLERKAPRTRKGRPVRRVIVVITDGFDSASTIDRRELLRRAQAAGVTVYSVTLPSYMLSATQARERVITPLDATRVVSTTGGRDFAADVHDFTPIFKALAEEIRASYALAFYPDKRDGQFHPVEIRSLRPEVKLRANRLGYQAPGTAPGTAPRPAQ
jgi:Ca-activated chloride channel homolog